MAPLRFVAHGGVAMRFYDPDELLRCVTELLARAPGVMAREGMEDVFLAAVRFRIDQIDDLLRGRGGQLEEGVRASLRRARVTLEMVSLDVATRTRKPCESGTRLRVAHVHHGG
jgi:hypothetical protein